MSDSPKPKDLEMSSLAKTKRLVLVVVSLVLGSLWQFIGYRIHPLYSVLLKCQLRYFRWRLRMRPDNLPLQNNVDGLHLMLLYDQKAPWREFEPLLEKLSSKTRVEFSEPLFYLFWINERFEEAEQVCDFWQNQALLWVRENENDAHSALNLLRQIATWKPGYRESGKLTGAEAINLRKQAAEYGEFWVTQYRNAKLAGLILEWLREQNYAPAIRFLRQQSINRHPPFPPRFYFAHEFGFDLSQELGMKQNTFLHLCRQAEIF